MAGHDFVVFCDNAEAQALLLQNAVTFKTKVDLLTSEELAGIEKSSIQYMDSWYRYQEFSKYKGLHLGSLYSFDFSFFDRIVLSVEKVIKAIEKEQPGVIVVSGSNRALTEDVICARGIEGVTCETYRMNPYEAMKSRLLGNPYLRYLMKSFNIRVLINEVRDYVFPIPREFMLKGEGGGRIKKNSVLVTAISRNEVCAAANPLRELTKRGHATVVFVIDGDGGRVLKRLELEGLGGYIRPGDLFNRHYKSLYRKVRAKLGKDWHGISNDAGFRDSLSYRGVPVLRYVSNEKLRWMVTKLSPYWAIIYEMISDLIKYSSVKAVIAMNDTINLGRVVATAAEESHIPSIDIQHGAFGSFPARAVAAKWCVWSDFDRDLLIREGIPACKLAVAGNPSYDSLISKRYEADAIKKKVRISGGYSSVITWAPTAEWFLCYHGEDYNERMFQGLQEVAGRCRDVKFLFKPHPSERVKRFKKILDKSSLGNVSIVDPEQSIDEILYISDIVMSWNSSVLVEAVILDKPIIGMNFFGQSEKVRCVSEGVAIEARGVGELENAIKDITSNNGDIAGSMKRARAAYIEKFLFRADGRASGRIVDILEDLMKDFSSQSCSL